MKKFPIVASMALLLSSCGSFSTITLGSSSSHSNATSSESSSSEPQVLETYFTVRFYTHDGSYNDVEVKSKDSVVRPADPTWEEIGRAHV